MISIDSPIMDPTFLELSFRSGKAFAGYLHLPRPSNTRCARSEPREAGLVVDFNSDGQPIGIEITAPKAASPEAVNRTLVALGLPPLPGEDLEPLRAA
jgi:hypothetical protein